MSVYIYVIGNGRPNKQSVLCYLIEHVFKLLLLYPTKSDLLWHFNPYAACDIIALFTRSL